MKIKIRYENEYQTFEVENVELEKWLNISISEEESQGDYEKRIQEEIEVKVNRPDYINWHRHNRHSVDAKVVKKDGEIEINTEEAIKENAVDESAYTKCIDETKEQFDYEYYCDFLYKNLKPDAAEMVIAIVLDGLTVSEYAERIGDEPNNVSHRYRRAINKLKKVFEKTSF